VEPGFLDETERRSVKVATKYEMCLFSHERPVKTPGIKFFLDEVWSMYRRFDVS